jgi:hypothetical protein
VEHIGRQLEHIERNMKLNTADPVARDGFTQIPNFILRDPNVSIGAKTVYSLLLSYAWHNDLCFPGQDRLAKDVGMGIASVNRFIKELEGCSLIEIARRGQGRTNFYTVNFVVKKQARKP